MDVFYLLIEARSLPYGPERVEVARRAVALADTLDDLQLAYTARVELIDSGTFGGRSEDAIVAFSWCESISNDYPDRFPKSELLWQYKWIVQSIPKFPQISRRQIVETMENMRATYESHQLSLRPNHIHWISVGIQLGLERAKIEEHYLKYRAADRDHYADCRACEANSEVEYHIHMGDYAAAVRESQPLFAGTLGCAEVPHLTYSSVLVAAMEQGDWELARRCFEHGYALCRDNPDFLGEIGNFMLYAISQGNLDTGYELFSRHVGWWNAGRVPTDRLSFEMGATALFQASSSDVSLQVPKQFPLHNFDGVYSPGDLEMYFRRQMMERVQAFDLRNNNAAVSMRMAAILELVSIA